MPLNLNSKLQFFRLSVLSAWRSFRSQFPRRALGNATVVISLHFFPFFFFFFNFGSLEITTPKDKRKTRKMVESKLTYEECRRQRMEENKKRMEELKLNVLAQSLKTPVSKPSPVTLSLSFSP